MEPVHEFHSPTNPTVIYACGRCGITAISRPTAEMCCRCGHPDCPEPKESIGRVYCSAHDKLRRAEREAELRAKYLALPVVNDKIDWAAVEMVYVGGQYYSDIVDAVDDLFYSDTPIDQIEAYVCERTVVPSPVLYDVVADAWAEAYDESFDGLPKEIEDALDVAQRALAEHATPMYLPVTSHRIDLAPFLARDGA